MKTKKVLSCSTVLLSLGLCVGSASATEYMGCGTFTLKTNWPASHTYVVASCTRVPEDSKEKVKETVKEGCRKVAGPLRGSSLELARKICKQGLINEKEFSDRRMTAVGAAVSINARTAGDKKGRIIEGNSVEGAMGTARYELQLVTIGHKEQMGYAVVGAGWDGASAAEFNFGALGKPDDRNEYFGSQFIAVAMRVK